MGYETHLMLKQIPNPCTKLNNQNNSIPRNDESNIPGTRIEPRSDKESPEVEIAKEKEVEITQETEVEITQETPAVDITKVIIPVNVTDEDKEITYEVYELKRREKGKNVEETRNSPIPTPIRSPRIHTNLVSSDTEKLQELTDTPHTTSSSSSPHKKLTKTNPLLSLFKTKPTHFKRYKSFFHELQRVIVYSLQHLRGDKHIKKQVMQQVPEQVRNQVPVNVEIFSSNSTHIEECNCQSQFTKSSIPEQYINCTLPKKVDPQLPTSSLSKQAVRTSEYEAYVSGESSFGQVFQEEQAPSTLGNQEQDDDFDFWTDSYASDNDEIPMKQVSQDIMEEVSLTIDEAKQRKMADEIWVNKSVKKFNPYARYGVEHWKNTHAKIFYIRKQKEPGKPKEEIYSNLKIVQVIKTYSELGHEHKFITEIVARRDNDCIIPDYADTRLIWSLFVFIRSLVIWERVHDFHLGIESYQQKVNLTAPTIAFPGIEEHDMFPIIYEIVHGIFTRIVERGKRYGYVQKDLTKDEIEYLKLFEEEIEKRLKHRRQMRRWEMYVNGRPLRLRRERPE
ncbi:hypothetical protein Tco_0873875 [Tanacetum coccineum]|uniref:Uncharacterized protein n=1 Tax=Tanacetum coccineum TaxID=301880 RepID=A0ABQ5BLQ0_9ASTR